MPLPTMHLRTARLTNLCCHQGLVAIASSNEAFIFANPSDGSEVKTTESVKSYKESSGAWALILETPWSVELWQGRI